jgi:hypothetical protein
MALTKLTGIESAICYLLFTMGSGSLHMGWYVKLTAFFVVHVVGLHRRVLVDYLGTALRLVHTFEIIFYSLIVAVSWPRPASGSLSIPRWSRYSLIFMANIMHTPLYFLSLIIVGNRSLGELWLLRLSLVDSGDVVLAAILLVLFGPSQRRLVHSRDIVLLIKHLFAT